MSTDWDDAKIKAANFNSRALNALFSMVTNEEFKKISSTEIAKEVWTILQTTYEGTETVKDSKLQRLTMNFEEIKMEENKLFNEFYAKLKDIVKSSFNLGETIPEPKVIKKVLRSLPERFHAKITTIEEWKDIEKIPLTELVGNLQTYELGLSRIEKSSKSKGMALEAKSSDTDESFDDEDSKMKFYITRNSKSSWKMSMQSDLLKTVSNLVHLSSRTTTEERSMPRKAVNILFPPDQNDSDVKVLDT